MGSGSGVIVFPSQKWTLGVIVHVIVNGQDFGVIVNGGGGVTRGRGGKRGGHGGWRASRAIYIAA